ncbi:hypothetical protein Ddye_015586 [Dipteronia dyeriana]|uniref:Uncharacterized protein n=1 Tax=Dipteronia dyeriana TaxID=168575 RepID=A0AAD9U580_9ROSI|nr:hypothetical protein Ddye_015586 [Dipteronia dyeriana]
MLVQFCLATNREREKGREKAMSPNQALLSPSAPSPLLVNAVDLALERRLQLPSAAGLASRSSTPSLSLLIRQSRCSRRRCRRPYSSTPSLVTEMSLSPCNC